VDAGGLELHVSRDWDHHLGTHLSDPMQHFEGSMGLSVTLSPQPSGGDGPLEVFRMSSPLQMINQHFPDELLGLNKTLSPQLTIITGMLEVLSLDSPHRGEPFLRIGMLDSPLPPSPQQIFPARPLNLAVLSPPLQDTENVATPHSFMAARSFQCVNVLSSHHNVSRCNTSRLDGSRGLNRDTSSQQPGTLELSCPSLPLQTYLGKSLTPMQGGDGSLPPTQVVIRSLPIKTFLNPQLLKVYHRRQLKSQCQQVHSQPQKDDHCVDIAEIAVEGMQDHVPLMNAPNPTV
jgi:hypothetical protein